MIIWLVSPFWLCQSAVRGGSEKLVSFPRVSFFVVVSFLHLTSCLFLFPDTSWYLSHTTTKKYQKRPCISCRQRNIDSRYLPGFMLMSRMLVKLPFLVIVLLSTNCWCWTQSTWRRQPRTASMWMSLTMDPTKVSSAVKFSGSNGAALEVSNVCISIGNNDVMSDVNWTILPKERWGLVGPNGTNHVFLPLSPSHNHTLIF